MLPVSSVAVLRCLNCGHLVLVHAHGEAACSGCGAVWVVAVRLEREPTMVAKKAG
jgi:ribosomal protein S27E